METAPATGAFRYHLLMPVQNPLEELRRRLHALPRWSPASVVVVAGSGTSIQATVGMPNGMGSAASWKGLLKLAVAHIDRQKKKPKGWNAESLLATLASQEISVDELLEVASSVEAALRKGETLGAFLDKTIGALSPVDTEVLSALGQLGVPMATTNYDGLLEWMHEVQALTWRYEAAVDGWFTGAQPGVLHLHGHYRAPDSVVLGRASYAATLGSAHAQNVLRNLFQQRTLLFVGMGGGLDDPNFGALLDWAIATHLPPDCFHVLLLREGEARRARARYPIDTGLRVLSYGSAYSDLAPYLRGLLRPAQQQAAALPAPPAPTGRPLPDRNQLRQRLGARLVTSADLEAFCLDYFPHVYQQFTRGMARTEQETLLLSRDQDLAPLLARLTALSPSSDSESTWRSLGTPSQGHSAIFTALLRLDRKPQWRAIRHDLTLRPDANRLVVLRAPQQQNLRLFVRRIEQMLTDPAESGLAQGRVSVRHIPLRLERSAAETASDWSLHLMKVLAAHGGTDSGTPAERLAEATAEGPLVLSLVETGDPLRLLRALPERRLAALRSFLCESLPAQIEGIQGVTVLLPIELVSPTVPPEPPTDHAPQPLPLWPAVSEWNPGHWQDIEQRPDAQLRRLLLDELHAPTWEDVQDYFWHHDPPLPSPQRMLAAMRPIYDRMQSADTTYEQLATAIDDLISDHT